MELSYHQTLICMKFSEESCQRSKAAYHSFVMYISISFQEFLASLQNSLLGQNVTSTFSKDLRSRHMSNECENKHKKTLLPLTLSLLTKETHRKKMLR